MLVSHLTHTNCVSMVFVPHVLKTLGLTGLPPNDAQNVGIRLVPTQSNPRGASKMKELETTAKHAEQQVDNVLLPSSSAKQEIKEIIHAIRHSDDTSHKFLLRVVQPGLAGLMDGSVSTLAPIFATAFATHNSFTAFLVGMASATGAGISMAFSEGLSDDGELTGRGSPVVRGTITGVMTFLGGSLHTLPFLLTNLGAALAAAYIVVAVEL